MHRIDHATAASDLHGAGKDGFTEGSPGTTPATVVTAKFLNAVQEEIAGTIEEVGIALDDGDHGQLKRAIVALAYGSPIVVHPHDGMSSMTIDDVPAWVAAIGNSMMTMEGSAALTIPVRLPVGATVTRVRALVEDSASRADPNDRMRVRLVRVTPDLDAPSNGTPEVIFEETDNGAGASLQVIDSGALSHVVQGSSLYHVVVRSGTSHDTGDIVHYAEISWTY